MLAQARGSYVCQRGDTATGLCNARDAPTAGIFAGLQRALNAWAAQRKLKFPRGALAVDGVIGTQTLAATKIVLGAIGEISIPQDVMTLAQDAQQYASFIAGQVGVAVDPSTPSAAPAVRRPTTALAPRGVPSPPLPEPIAEEPKKRRWIWWTVGGVLLLGASLLGYRVYRSRAGGFADAYEEAPGDFIDV